MQIDHDRSVSNRTGLIDDTQGMRRKTQDPLLGCPEQNDAGSLTLPVRHRLLSIFIELQFLIHTSEER